MKRRKLRKDRLFIVAIITTIFTITIMVIINSILSLFLNKNPIDYSYKHVNDLSNLPKSIFNNEALSGDMFKVYEDDTYTSILGIDVSSHQQTIDWQKIKDAGIEFVYIRSGYRGYQSGKLNQDEMFISHYKGAKSVGLDVGVYFFSHAINEKEAIEEAYFTHDLIKDLDIDLEVVYDLEDIDYDESRLDDIDSETRSNCAIAYLSKIEELGYKPMLYTNKYWANTHFNLNKVMNYPIWFAQYEDYPEFDYYFTLWQYTDQAIFDGVDIPSDLNIKLVKK